MTETDIQDVLEKELEVLKVKFSLNESLCVVWKPAFSEDVSGEVKCRTIIVYEQDEGAAVKVLKHEVLDYCLTSRIIKPLVGLVNLLIRSRANEIYKEKEKFVEAILSFMD